MFSSVAFCVALDRNVLRYDFIIDTAEKHFCREAVIIFLSFFSDSLAKAN